MWYSSTMELTSATVSRTIARKINSVMSIPKQLQKHTKGQAKTE